MLPIENSVEAPRHIIRILHTAHCKRGPQRCEKCREMNVEQICLLDINPPDAGLMQRRVIQVGDSWHEFDVVKVFDGADEARAYAAEHHVIDIQLKA